MRSTCLTLSDFLCLMTETEENKKSKLCEVPLSADILPIESSVVDMDAQTYASLEFTWMQVNQ